MAAAIDPELLSKQTGWLRALALELLGDGHRAEDAVQEVCLAALERPPRGAGDERGLRAWLAQVVRRRAAGLARSEGRRARRERRAARDERVPSAADAVARADAQRRLLAAVMALEPADREVVVLRWFEGLAPREIAERTGATGSAVRSRLSRALEVLRARLGGRPGARRRALGLALLGTRGGWRGRWRPGSAWAGTRGGLALLPLGAAAAAGWLVLAAPPLEPPAVPSEAGARATAVATAAPTAPVRRVDAALPAGRVPRAAAASSGRVVDLRGRPLAGVEVTAAMERVLTRARTGSDGRFAFALHGEHALLWIADEQHASLRACVAQRDDRESDRVLVAAPARAVEGRVVGAAGDPIAGAEVALVVPDRAFAGLSVPLDATLSRRRSGGGHDHFTLAGLPADLESLVAAYEGGARVARTDRSGWFRLAGVPDVAGAALAASAPGHESRELPLAGDAVLLELVLERDAERTAAPVVRGTVVDDRGRPVEDAAVRLGSREVRTGRDGTFAIGRPPGVAGAPLVAAKPGWQPAVLDAFPRAGGGSAPVRLVLPGRALAIEARLVREDGSPCAGFGVTLLDGCVADGTRMPPVLAEDLARGAPNVLHTAPDGSVRLAGLRSGHYRLRAWNPADLQLVESPPLPAGARGAVVTVSRAAARRRIHGVVRSVDGAPHAGVEVALKLPVHDNGRGFRSSERGPAVRTDAGGRFDLGEVVVERTLLVVSGPDVMTLERALDGSAGFFDLCVPARCRFRFDAGAGPEPDAIALLDAAGRPLRLYSLAFGASFGDLEYRLARGRTPVLAVSEEARTLVVRRGGAECARVPVHLTPGGIAVLTP